jgi:outer membrane biosynthesis protein TonB
MTHRTLPKALSLAFVLAAASLGPLLLPGTAFAESPKDAATGDHAAAKADPAADAKPTKHAAKPKHKSKKGATAAKTHASPKAHAKHDKATPKAATTKRSAARENKASGSKRSKTQPKADAGDAPEAGGARSHATCTGTAIALDRGGVEADRFPLVDCKGRPLDSAVTKVSVLARPLGAPKHAALKTSLVDRGVIRRIHSISKKFPGRTITLVGGPGSSAGGGSAHRSGRAVDLRVDGVENQKVIELCRTLADTGCGFYPNASFVHLDVRAPGAGKSYWIDASEPGESPRYVPTWPPPQAASGATATK